MRIRLFILLGILCLSCQDSVMVDDDTLSNYLQANSALSLDEVVACAGGNEDGLLGSVSQPIDVFFYPVSGATEFRYFEYNGTAAPQDFSNYVAKDLSSEPIFNGYLRKFNNGPINDDRYGIVTFKTSTKLHVSNPIRLKTNTKPTEENSTLITVNQNGVNPSFEWEDGLIDENAIYFHVISDSNNEFISGTYTVDKQFSFYDLSNVVFNITDTTSIPALEPNRDYKFTLMAVSEDNWINLYAEKLFFTQ